MLHQGSLPSITLRMNGAPTLAKWRLFLYDRNSSVVIFFLNTGWMIYYFSQFHGLLDSRRFGSSVNRVALRCYCPLADFVRQRDAGEIRHTGLKTTFMHCSSKHTDRECSCLFKISLKYIQIGSVFLQVCFQRQIITELHQKKPGADS